MRKYPDSHEYIKQRVQELTQHDLEGLVSAGLAPN